MRRTESLIIPPEALINKNEKWDTEIQYWIGWYYHIDIILDDEYHNTCFVQKWKLDKCPEKLRIIATMRIIQTAHISEEHETGSYIIEWEEL